MRIFVEHDWESERLFFDRRVHRTHFFREFTAEASAVRLVSVEGGGDIRFRNLPDEQSRRHLPRVLSSLIVCCQGSPASPS